MKKFRPIKLTPKVTDLKTFMEISAKANNLPTPDYQKQKEINDSIINLINDKKMKKTFKDSYGQKVYYNDSQEVKDKVFEKLLEYFKEYEAFCGDSICQMDNPQIYAPVYLAEIADDIIEFEVDYDDDYE